MNSPGKNFFSIRLKKAGLDPTKDVEFKQFPGPLLRVAVEKGEAHALADNDPITFLFQKDGAFREVSSNLDGEYAPSRLLHRRRARQPDPRRQARGGRHRALADRGLGIRRASSGRGRRDLSFPMRPARSSSPIWSRWRNTTPTITIRSAPI